MGAAVEADNRLAVEIFQGQRGEAKPFSPCSSVQPAPAALRE
jgi:hypothetical protein